MNSVVVRPSTGTRQVAAGGDRAAAPRRDRHTRTQPRLAQSAEHSPGDHLWVGRGGGRRHPNRHHPACEARPGDQWAAQWGRVWPGGCDGRGEMFPADAGPGLGWAGPRGAAVPRCLLLPGRRSSAQIKKYRKYQQAAARRATFSLAPTLEGKRRDFHVNLMLAMWGTCDVCYAVGIIVKFPCCCIDRLILKNRTRVRLRVNLFALHWTSRVNLPEFKGLCSVTITSPAASPHSAPSRHMLLVGVLGLWANFSQMSAQNVFIC